jgi:hypothetical protein
MNESRITRPGHNGTTAKPRVKKRLSEKELGTLYAYCGSPLRLHTMLEKEFPKAGTAIEGFDESSLLAELHDSLSEQGPDDALLSLALMGYILEDYISFYYADETSVRVLATELKCEADNIVHDLGRLRIDLDSYRAQIAETEILEHLKHVPESLCVLASIYQEMQEGLKAIGRKDLSKLARLLCYQAEAQADHAWNYVQAMVTPEEGKAAKDALDNIPLPMDMQTASDSDKVVDLSLFRRR